MGMPLSRTVPRISQRISAIAPSATLAVDAKAKALKAAGEPVIGFGAGEPDFPTPPHIVAAAEAACSVVSNHRYTPAGGLPDLREAIAVKTKRDSGIDVDAADVLVTNGGKHAVYNTLLALLDEGDEAIIPAPFWTTYPEPVALAGGVPVYVDTDETTGFKATIDQLEAVRTDRTKLIIFVSPSNPTGAVYSKAQVEAVGRWALEHGIFVVTDEIYEHLTFGDNEFHSILRLVPELADRCVILNGVAKTFAMTGWRVGWMIGPRDVIKAATNLQSHSTSNVCNVAQRAAIAAVSGPLDAVVDMRSAFERRSKVAHSLLSAIDGVTCIEPEGAFYAFPNLTGLLGRPIRGRKAENTIELAEILLEEAKVAVVPGEAFGAPGYARLSFALGDDDLAEGLRRIDELVSS